jgi:hypothetical protein
MEDVLRESAACREKLAVEKAPATRKMAFIGGPRRDDHAARIADQPRPRAIAPGVGGPPRTLH